MNTPDCMLACGHWRRLRLDLAVFGAVENCEFCGQTAVVKINYHEYHTRCIFPACRYSRWFGQSQELAKAGRNRHLAAYPDHACTVAWDRVTWDGRGSVFREGVDRASRTTPRPAPAFQGVLAAEIPPPF